MSSDIDKSFLRGKIALLLRTIGLYLNPHDLYLEIIIIAIGCYHTIASKLPDSPLGPLPSGLHAFARINLTTGLPRVGGVLLPIG